MREMTVSKTPWISEYPSAWTQVPLHALFNEHKHKNKDCSEQNLLSLSYGNIVRKDINTNEGLLPESFNGYNVIENGDIVLRLTDLQNDHRSLRTGLATERGIITSAYVTLRKKAPLSSEYYHYLFHAFDVMKVFYSMGEGIRQSIGYDELAYIVIPQPSLPEQCAIVSYLDAKCAAVDKAIERHKKVIEKLEEYKKSVITKTVYAGLKGTPLKGSGDWCGAIPEKWTLPRIKHLLKERDLRSESGAEEPLSMSQKVGLVPTKELGDIPHGASSFVGAKIVYPDDLVFNKLKAHLGVFSVSKYAGLVSSDYAVYYATQKADVKYLEYVFKTPQCIGEFIKRATGVGQGLTRLYTGQLFDIKCPCPSIEEQHQITTYLDEVCFKVHEAKLRHQALIERLGEYRKSIIYNAATGKIDCREVAT